MRQIKNTCIYLQYNDQCAFFYVREGYSLENVGHLHEIVKTELVATETYKAVLIIECELDPIGISSSAKWLHTQYQIETIVINAKSSMIELIQEHLGQINLNPDFSFVRAREIALNIELQFEQAKLVGKAKTRLAVERESLTDHHFVKKVQDVSVHDFTKLGDARKSLAVQELFEASSYEKRRLNGAAGFIEKTRQGVFFTRSMALPCSLVLPDQNIPFARSKHTKWLIKLKNEAVWFEIGVDRYRYKVVGHAELDITDLGVHYKPAYERLIEIPI